MSFFDSEFVQEELSEIQRLQKEIYSKMMSLSELCREDRIAHIDKLKTLLEKQRVMYTRLSLSDDPDAVELKKQLERSVEVMGFPAGTDIQILFDGMKGTIENLESHID